MSDRGKKDKGTDWSKRRAYVAYSGGEGDEETDGERLERRKRQFHVVVNLFQNIEAYVLIHWEKNRSGLPLEWAARMAEQSGLTRLGYSILGSLLKQSDKIQIMGGVGFYELAPRAIDVVALEKEAS